ncbi:MAG: hypothetical protein F4X12_16800 [Acidobacteriia bacterium]|nr:hypothetical protein [Terriglobia bacterium]
MSKVGLRDLGVAQDQPRQGEVGEAARHHETLVTCSWIENIDRDALLDSSPPLPRQFAAWVTRHDEVFDGGLLSKASRDEGGAFRAAPGTRERDEHQGALEGQQIALG